MCPKGSAEMGRLNSFERMTDCKMDTSLLFTPELALRVVRALDNTVNGSSLTALSDFPC